MRALTALTCCLALAPLLPATTRAQRAGSSPFRVEEATIAQIHAAMREKGLTCRALVTEYLKRIEAYQPAWAGAQRDRAHQSQRAAGGR